MKSHFSFSDEEFEKTFEDLSFPVTLFSHEAHLRLGYIHINKYGIEKAIKNMCKQIKIFATYHGAPKKFNATVTYASLHIMRMYIEVSKTDKFHDLLEEFPLLLSDFKKEIKKFYSVDVFNNEIAKREIINPDIKPFE